MLKADWEKSDTLVSLSDDTIRAMAAAGMPGKPLASHAVISGGCANLNVKLTFSGMERPVILRIYLRDKAAALREKNLSQLVAPAVPVPEFIFVGDHDGYRFALVQCCEGITLRDVLLKTPEDAACAVHDAGAICAALQRHRFAQGGSFDENLAVKTVGSLPDYLAFADECLSKPFVHAQFEHQKIKRLSRLLEKNRAFLPDDRQSFLVHGDYDPANIFVRSDGNGWTVSAILDWEFAFSGPWLWDLSNMLRYAHRLPPAYEGAFLEGLKEGGAKLPENWRMTFRLMNITSLLDCLARAEGGNRTRTCADICQLTDEIADWLERQAA